MPHKIHISLLRGICQIPAYVACDRGLLADRGIEATVDVAATAWMVPQKLINGDSQFAVIPWTRVAAAEARDIPLTLIAGSGCEEVAIVVRRGLDPKDVKSVAVPVRGGMKDLTAMGLINDLGWQDARLIRLPSGDGAILAFVGRGADAASMVEPYATMLEGLGMGTVIRRTGDIWKGAPGCSLTTTVDFKRAEPGIVSAVVGAFVDGARFVEEQPDEAARIAARYIGIDAGFIREALNRNRPNVDALRSSEAMGRILTLMQKLGYVERRPESFMDLSFLDAAQAGVGR